MIDPDAVEEFRCDAGCGAVLAFDGTCDGCVDRQARDDAAFRLHAGSIRLERETFPDGAVLTSREEGRDG